jgi:hypothetical protein
MTQQMISPDAARVRVREAMADVADFNPAYGSTDSSEWSVAVRYDDLAALLGQGAGDVTSPARKCASHKQGLPEPADCNWPVCGCDPYAARVIDALEESGIVPSGFASATPPPPEQNAAADALASLVEGLGAALRQFSEPMALLNRHELGERLANDVGELIRRHQQEREDWTGGRAWPDMLEHIASYWGEWEENRAGTGTYTPEELAEDGGEFANGLADHLAALRAVDAPPGGVPVGWKLVPAEPTQDMNDAATEVLVDDGRGRHTALNWSEAADVYRAMLAAAPAIPDPAPNVQALIEALHRLDDNLEEMGLVPEGHARSTLQAALTSIQAASGEVKS